MLKKTSEQIITAYACCPRKAFLLLNSSSDSRQHEYALILEKAREQNLLEFIAKLQQQGVQLHTYQNANSLAQNYDYVCDAKLESETLVAHCEILTRVEDKSQKGYFHYEPTIVTGTYKIDKLDKLRLYVIALVLEQVQQYFPQVGHIVTRDSRIHNVKLENAHKHLLPYLEPQEWTKVSEFEAPPVVLNKHCHVCQFQKSCREIAIKEDNLSLLERTTPKIIRQYERKGIFTVKQLSYLFKPRKRKKTARNPAPDTHNLELQALAICEQKVYLHELPKLERKPIEIFLDIEGVPDQDLYYLIGVLICKGDDKEYHSYWADTAAEEQKIWHQLIEKIEQFPQAPIYHYGSYEHKAFNHLAARYGTDLDKHRTRLYNVNKLIYGKIYFPVYSNSLKVIGDFIGATWTHIDTSGLRALCWRLSWERTSDHRYKENLNIYNEEDCCALRILVLYLCGIGDRIDISAELVEADMYKKESASMHQEVVEQFNEIFKMAHFGYDKNKISFRKDSPKSAGDRSENARQSANIQYQKYLDRKRRAKKIVYVANGTVCPKCGNQSLKTTEKTARRYIIDLELTQRGIRKTIIEYIGYCGYCNYCQRSYSPPDIRKYGRQQAFGHGMASWVIYQRVVLRLPYESIVSSLKEQFAEEIAASRCVEFIKRYAEFYAETQESIRSQLLESPFIHADETTANIRGETWYVWVFTDGDKVIFKLSETREAITAQEFLVGYKGVLISDFYPGYDSLDCEQQKCWVHLIRDLNEGLIDNPHDSEFVELVNSIRDLIVPILEAEIKYGLKKRHFAKFKEHVDKFYNNHIDGKNYKSDIASRFQKRFIRYRNSLFTFLAKDGITWHNNRAESAIRHFAKQRDASSPMYDSAVRSYLVLLGIYQTCRFQDKSFFQFLFSGQKDLLGFKRYKR
ncbi:MAG: TM0106 family RecB-like putative nuclease [Caldilineaceae bacterium]